MGLTAKEFAYHKEVQELKQERDDIDRVANMYADEVATRIIKTVKQQEIIEKLEKRNYELLKELANKLKEK